jgi:hypothetical protein
LLIETRSKILLNGSNFEGNSIFKKTIISCYFQGEICDHNDFDIYYSSYHGLCYKFNGGSNQNKSKLINRAGKEYGLNIEMYLDMANQSIQNIFFYNDGVFLAVHNDHLKTFIQNIEIPTGTHTNIGINRVNDIKLAEPYNKCKNFKSLSDHNSFLYNKTFEEYEQYKQMLILFSNS